MQEREMSVGSTPVLGPMPPMMAVTYAEMPVPSRWARWRFWIRVRVRKVWFGIFG